MSKCQFNLKKREMRVGGLKDEKKEGGLSGTEYELAWEFSPSIAQTRKNFLDREGL